MNHAEFLAHQAAEVIEAADPLRLHRLAAVRCLIADAGIEPCWSPPLAHVADDSTPEAWLASVAYCIDRHMDHAMYDLLAAMPPKLAVKR